MNKVLKAVSVVFVLAFIVGNVFAAGEVNVKAGFGMGPSDGEAIGDRADSELLKGFNIGAEYLYPINDKMKVGAGAFYVSATEGFLPPPLADDYAWTYLPVYGTFQIHPFSSPLFFKANVGYSVYAGIDWGDDDDIFGSGSSVKGGLYFGISVGREALSGWFWEVSYNRLAATLSVKVPSVVITDSGIEMRTTTVENDFVYNFVGFSIGKKFKL